MELSKKSKVEPREGMAVVVGVLFFWHLLPKLLGHQQLTSGDVANH